MYSLNYFSVSQDHLKDQLDKKSTEDRERLQKQLELNQLQSEVYLLQNQLQNEGNLTSPVAGRVLEIKASVGDLKKVKRVLKVTGMVNAAPNFTDHPKVMNGCSDLLVEVFGENGKHTRVAVGMNSLPLNIAVEIDMIVEISN